MNFSELGIKPELAAFLASQGFKTPSPVQEQGIPVLLKKRSAVLKAPTGSGKTLAYLIPILNDLTLDGGLQAVIIVPTMILVRQLSEVMRPFQRGFLPFKADLLYPGSQSEGELRGQIAVATPDQFLFSLPRLNLKPLRRLVIDEGDMILFGGFEQELSRILDLDLPSAAKYLFTASIDEHLNTMVRRFIGADTLVDVGSTGVNAGNISHYLVDVRHMDRAKALELFLGFKKPFKTIVFVSRKDELAELDARLDADGISHLTVSGAMPKREQRKNCRLFEDPNRSLLIATDIAARGLDFKDVTDVISLDLPYELSYYFHRAGRAGRFYAHGSSYVFYDNDETDKARQLIRKGVKFAFLSLRPDGLKNESALSGKTPERLENKYLSREIKSVIRRLHSNKVKPNYKKRLKEAVKRVKERHRDDIIKANIRHRNATEGTSFAFAERRPYKGKQKKRGD